VRRVEGDPELLGKKSRITGKMGKDTFEASQHFIEINKY
jgi:hypothetical protein